MAAEYTCGWNQAGMADKGRLLLLVVLTGKQAQMGSRSSFA